ncbi:MAG: hypothetical protein HZB71_06500 [Betaproteobacteria bacterium]|nr:hypothetical protein [Betaproteobacteria bacterium]
MRRAFLKSVAALAGASVLAGCGFKLRGSAQLRFDSAYVDAPDTSLTRELRQTLTSHGKLAEKPELATLRILLEGERRAKAILSLTSAGKVREYRLELRVTLSVLDQAGKSVLNPGEVFVQRDMTYDDQQALAKELEETGLYRAMELDALRQILRRLDTIKLKKPADAAP